MSPIDIVYKPVKKEDEIIECFFSLKINLAYRSTFSENQKIRHGTAFQCYFCSNYYSRKDKYDRHMENCSGKPGYVYNFNIQNLLTFEENLKFKRNIPLTAYIDFETTAPTDDCLDPETRKMKAVSYVIIFAFHPDLKLNRIIIERSFGHPIEKLTSLDYLTIEQLKYKDLTTLKQLRDCALSVTTRKNEFPISEMFSTELKFASECLINWLNWKYKNQNLQLSNETKRNYEIENPINWESDRCRLCNFPLHINPTVSDVSKEYENFIIQKEHKFLRNFFLRKNYYLATQLKILNLFMKILQNFYKLSFIYKIVLIR